MKQVPERHTLANRKTHTDQALQQTASLLCLPPQRSTTARFYQAEWFRQCGRFQQRVPPKTSVQTKHSPRKPALCGKRQASVSWHEARLLVGEEVAGHFLFGQAGWKNVAHGGIELSSVLRKETQPSRSYTATLPPLHLGNGNSNIKGNSYITRPSVHGRGSLGTTTDVKKKINGVNGLHGALVFDV